ncbi:MAG: ADP-ribosylglycohydrolase family protein [Leptospiraceae bacterium]|nr:ADP-ribosylglycohydrolase family protein [Leptospiraceae bacterium]MCP5502569.1 ADP-ribosylglycohydrolase family protein [Leptospiraceae bacterium]
MKDINSNIVRAGLLGLAVGDALGVPLEFKHRDYFIEHEVKDMLGYGTHHQPPGTWSDDSSLSFCLAESLCGGYHLKEIANKFILWLEKGYWTAYGTVFDIGISTSAALHRYKENGDPYHCGAYLESENGNGSLMRILPLCFYLHGKNIKEDEKFSLISEISGITHTHIRSVICCYIYIDFCLFLLEGKTLQEAYLSVCKLKEKYRAIVDEKEWKVLHKILSGDIETIASEKIQSEGYVVYTLEAALYCLLTTGSYKEAVLKAVNLGYDTDTTACVVGGPAGLYYGLENIPESWRAQLARKEDIEELADSLHRACYEMKV